MKVHEMSRNQVIKALRTCAKADCKNCMLYRLCLKNNDAANEMLLRAADILEARK